MAEPEVYLEKLSAFSRMLRLEGLTVSPKETEDAARMLIQLGFQDREQVKTALRTVFASSREEQISFDRVFDGFFITEEQMRNQAKKSIVRQMEDHTLPFRITWRISLIRRDIANRKDRHINISRKPDNAMK